MRKLHEKKGETISEVLIAALIGCLGALLFTSMSVTAVKLTRMAVEHMGEYAAIESAIEKQAEESLIYGEMKSVWISDSEGNNYGEFVSSENDGKVKVYGNAGKTIYGYQR